MYGIMWSSEASRHLLQVLGSFVFFQWINSYLTPHICYYLPAYNNLNNEKKIEWYARMTSNIHAVLVSFTCVYVVAFDEETKKNTMWSESWIAKSNIAFVMGYLLSDCLLMFLKFNEVGGTLSYVFHHLSAIYAYYYVLAYGVLAYFANFRLLAEISTPFVNARWYLDVTGNKKTNLYTVNGIIVVCSFFMFRMAAMPYYYYSVIETFGTEDFDKLGFWVQLAWISSCILLDITNFFWFYKLMKGLVKTLRSMKVQQKCNGHADQQVATKAE